jgi:hypothetical protein
MYIGDFRLGDTFDVKFCTVQSSGAPTTLAGSPVVSAYPGNSTTELTAGITLSVDFDSRTGMHNVRVVATGGNGYATATNYALVITTGTVNSVSAVGYLIGHFSIENRSALMPTTAARTLDVTATGGAGIDWANVEAPTTTLDLSGTTIKTTQKVDVDTIKTNPVVNGGTLTFPTNATVASTTNLTAGTVTTATNVTTVNGLAANVVTAAAIADGAIDRATFAADTGLQSMRSNTAQAGRGGHDHAGRLRECRRQLLHRCVRVSDRRHRRRAVSVDLGLHRGDESGDRQSELGDESGQHVDVRDPAVWAVWMSASGSARLSTR